jgi:enolase-phosphatase E1
LTTQLGEAPIRAVLLDIEGTTTSIDFVTQTLFPFARRHLAEFVERHYDAPDLKATIAQLRAEQQLDASQDPGCPVWRSDSRRAQTQSAVAYLEWLMDQDRKSTPLKWLQGRIWELGYQTGALSSHVYPDVPPAFRRWQRKGKAIGIFSSGSVLAQRLLFAHTTAGNLGSFIRSYFDTTTGPKKAPESYQRIAQTLDLPSSAILFLSDTIAELNAAQSAGMQSALCARPENLAQDPKGHLVIRSFDEVLP